MPEIKAMSELYDSMSKPGTKIVVLPHHEQGEMKGKVILIRIAVYDEKGNTLNFCDIDNYHHNHGSYMSFLVHSEGTVYSYNSSQAMYPQLQNTLYDILKKIEKQEIEYNKKYDNQEFFAVVPVFKELLLNHQSTTSTPAKQSTHLPEKALSDENKSTTSTPIPKTTEEQAILNTDQGWQKTDLDRIMSESYSRMTNKKAEKIWKTANRLKETAFNEATEKVNDTMKEIKEQNRYDNISLPDNVTDNDIRISSFNLLDVNNGGIENTKLPTPGITWGASIPITAWTALGVIGGVTGGIVGILAVGLIGKAAYSLCTKSNDGQYVAVQQRKPSTYIKGPDIDKIEEGIALN